MWATLLGLFPGLFSTINGITNAIANQKIAALNAQTDQERIHVEERIKTLETQRDVLIEDAKHSKLDLYVRTVIGLEVAVLLGKIFIWDMTLGWGVTRIPNDAYIWNVIMATAGFYFVSSALSFFRK